MRSSGLAPAAGVIDVPALIPATTSHVGNVFFGLALALVFLRFSIIHQVLSYLLGANLYLLYLIGIPAIFGVFVTGRLYDVLRTPTSRYWTLYALWIAAAVPFSYWPGHSFSVLSEYLRTNLVMLFVIAGLTVNWNQCRRMMFVIAAGALTNLMTAELFAGSRYGGRLSLGAGSIADPNDFAAHLLLVLPFLLWVVFSARFTPFRLAALLGIAAGMFYVLRTASRGALIGIAAGVLFYLFRATTRQRLALACLAPAVLAFLIVAVPKNSWDRLLSLSRDTGTEGETTEAAQSTESREYLLRKSMQYTFEHPVFGVGPGEFSEYEGVNNRLTGMTHGYWHDTHNTLTQVSSECGIPAAIFFIAGIASTFGLLNRTYREAKRRANCQDIRNTAFCLMLAFTAFCTATAFLNFAYFFYYPAMGGLAIAVASAAKEEFRARDRLPAQPQQAMPWAPPVRRSPAVKPA